MQPAVERLRRAIQTGEKILIYGDYDVDGTTSVVLLTKAVAACRRRRRLPCAAPLEGGVRHAPRSGGDGRRARRHPDDQRGYRHPRGARWWRARSELGIDTIVTDHHLPDSATAARASPC